MTKQDAPTTTDAEFEAWWLSEQLKTFPKDYDRSRLADWGSMFKDKAELAWQAARASSAAAQWLLIETAPKNRTLLLGYFNSHGNWRTLRGQWFSQDEIDENWEEPEPDAEGWYETPVEIDEPPNVFCTEPTHWQPLPAPPAKPADTGEAPDA